MTSLARRVESFIRDVPNFPKKGILFKDITPLLQDGATFDRVCASMADYGARMGSDLVMAIEARGFIFGSAVATRMGVGLVPVRKKGKLPWKTFRQTYALEYGKDTIEIHKDALKKGTRVLIVDDLLATGGTLAAACQLAEKAGGVVAGCACVVELSSLNGRKKLKGRPFFTIVRY